MKKFLSFCLLACLAACTSETEYGDCVGLTDDKNPTLHYEADVGNIVLAIIFSETVIVPVVVGVSELECPVGRR